MTKINLNQITNLICESTSATSAALTEHIQSLWSGYGSIDRYALEGSSSSSVVVKHINPPEITHHPRGWNTHIGHQRKLRSYLVEVAWYKNFADRCTSQCRIPKCLGIYESNGEKLLIMEDLHSVGFHNHRNNITINEMKVCLSWLANFHALFLDVKPHQLWDTGTYWHLDTRPEELDEMDDTALKNAASAIDSLLKECPHQTLVHGDAKLANFCFNKNGSKVAAVDFQYVGGGIGMKDVAYFIGSCLHEEDCAYYEQELLDHYFVNLRISLGSYEKDVDLNLIEDSWRKLFPVAWTDFHRFLKGWSPGHWKINSYSERLAKKVVTEINRGKSR